MQFIYSHVHVVTYCRQLNGHFDSDNDTSIGVEGRQRSVQTVSDTLSQLLLLFDDFLIATVAPRRKDTNTPRNSLDEPCCMNTQNIQAIPDSPPINHRTFYSLTWLR